MIPLKFPQTFRHDFLERVFYHSEHFVENEKYGNHLGQGLVNIVDGVEETSLKAILFPERFLLNVSLLYDEEVQRFFYCLVRGVFFEDFDVYFFKWQQIVARDVSR